MERQEHRNQNKKSEQVKRIVTQERKLSDGQSVLVRMLESGMARMNENWSERERGKRKDEPGEKNAD
jgi:hypothetical protein